MNLNYPKLKKDRNFSPCPIDKNDEFYDNGIFTFNITKMIAFIERNKDQIPLEAIDIEPYRSSPEDLNESQVQVANLSNPLILAQISPRGCNVIDGHHRIEKACRLGMTKLPAHKLTPAEHVSFLISEKAYSAYIEWWNDKIKEIKKESRYQTA